MGGFECATHRRRDGKRIDVIGEAQHDRFASRDYALLADAGIRTVRDAFRWHLIETQPYTYDWSSAMSQLEAARDTGTQVIWDLCHWGLPDGFDPFCVEFVPRFAEFAGAAAAFVRDFHQQHNIHAARIYCPINEISFWSWVGGDVEYFYPFAQGRGPELKRQLVRGSLAAMRAVRDADPSARFLQAEPLIHISERRFDPGCTVGVAGHNGAQFEAWDMLAGRQDPHLGGSDEFLDLVGINFYWDNQWVHNAERTPLGHALHRPLHEQLVEVWDRYRRPLLLSETGAESQAGPGWLGYVCAEVRQAMRLGVPVAGFCLYPVADYPGWDDDRHCPCGLIEVSQDWQGRALRAAFCDELRVQQTIFAGLQFQSLDPEQNEAFRGPAAA